MRSRTCDRGFSLVEVLVAMVILMIGLVAVVGQWPAGTQLVMASEWQSEASVRAELQLEALDAMPWPPTSGSRVEGKYTVTWTVSHGPVPGSLYAEVVVAWSYQGRPSSVRMGTVLSQEL